jgi:hypothetical protein
MPFSVSAAIAVSASIFSLVKSTGEYMLSDYIGKFSISNREKATLVLSEEGNGYKSWVMVQNLAKLSSV